MLPKESLSPGQSTSTRLRQVTPPAGGSALSDCPATRRVAARGSHDEARCVAAAQRSVRAAARLAGVAPGARVCARAHAAVSPRLGSGAAGNKFKMSLGLPVGAVMNCADNTGAKNLYIISVKRASPCARAPAAAPRALTRSPPPPQAGARV